jgi:hypothetical protein
LTGLSGLQETTKTRRELRGKLLVPFNRADRSGKAANNRGHVHLQIVLAFGWVAKMGGGAPLRQGFLWMGAGEIPVSLSGPDAVPPPCGTIPS